MLHYKLLCCDVMMGINGIYFSFRLLLIKLNKFGAMKRASYVKTPPLTMICIFQLCDMPILV